MFDLKGHVALVTGGNGGIGLAFARGLVKSCEIEGGHRVHRTDQTLRLEPPSG